MVGVFRGVTPTTRGGRGAILHPFFHPFFAPFHPFGGGVLPPYTPPICPLYAPLESRAGSVRPPRHSAPRAKPSPWGLAPLALSAPEARPLRGGYRRRCAVTFEEVK